MNAGPCFCFAVLEEVNEARLVTLGGTDGAGLPPGGTSSRMSWPRCVVCGGVLEAREGSSDAPPYIHTHTQTHHTLCTHAQPSFTSTHRCPRFNIVSTSEPQTRESHGHCDVAEDKIPPCQKIQIVYLLVCHNPGVHRCVLCCVNSVLVLLPVY